MKTCPFCAEEIQDAAIVCKHCQRDLVPLPPSAATVPAAVAAEPAKPVSHAGRNFLIVVGLVVVFYYLVFGRQDFYAFDAKREDWHRRCDAYVGRDPRGSADAERMRACKAELEELTAYATAKGWR